MDKLIEKILFLGLPLTFLLVLVFLIVQDPNRAFKLKSLVIGPFYKLFKWFKRSYIANEVCRNLNVFFQKELIDHSYTFKINWVKDADNPILKGESLVIRMRREDDQTKNILTAAKFALPQVICPLFRYNVHPMYSTAIDFAVLHKLAEKLGNHGKALYRKYFLNPELENYPLLTESLQKLLKIDQYGIFTTIFLTELDYIGEGLYGSSDTKDRSQELNQFINYLFTLSEREIGEELGEKLANFSDVFKQSIILLAKSQIASKKGLIPYLRRVNKNLEKGCDSIYIIAFPPAFQFFNKFIDVIDGNQRVTIVNVYRQRDSNSLQICCLRRNKLYTNESFKQKIQASNIHVGQIVQGTILDVSQNDALITFLGVDGALSRNECSWNNYAYCSEILKEGEVKSFIVKDIDNSNGTIKLSLKFPDQDPWKKIQIPKVGDQIEVYVLGKDNLNFICLYQNLIDVHISLSEMSWYGLSNDEQYNLINTSIQTKVISIDIVNRYIRCSTRQLEVDPWPIIHEHYKVGREFNGKIVEVNEHFVRVKIENDLVGKIPKESLVKAGFEYENFKENLVVGQGVDVVITKVFINKRWIRLELKRNLISLVH